MGRGKWKREKGKGEGRRERRRKGEGREGKRNAEFRNLTDVLVSIPSIKLTPVKFVAIHTAIHY